jgi:hypothetical protein
LAGRCRFDKRWYGGESCLELAVWCLRTSILVDTCWASKCRGL